MFGNILRKILPSKQERDIKMLEPIVEQINELEQSIAALSDEALRRKTDEFKHRLADGETLDDILPEAFAVVRETAKRTIKLRHFDVQLMGGIVLHQGKIAEMATGEGKTLVATLPLYLNALEGKGCHLVTVNDYLARRDAEWMGPIYHFLGLKVGVVNHDKSFLYSPNPKGRTTQLGSGEELQVVPRKEAYLADITYGTNTEFGFDYLRDNMAIRLEDLVQREYNYVIVDEVDSILIDEARTPLIISGPVEHSTHKFDEMKPLVERLVRNQTLLVNRLLSEAEKLLEEGKEYEAGIKFLQVRRGAPKHKRLMKLEKEKGVLRHIERVELDYTRDKKLHELDEELFFSIDEKTHVVDLTEKGRTALSPHDPDFFVLPDIEEQRRKIDAEEGLSELEKLAKKQAIEQAFIEKSERLQNISQLLKAYSLYEKDVEYVVADGKVVIVDEFTGRLMPGRRFSDGLHEALEAKEGVRIERETQTLATITIQNYFRMYQKVAGMTGTAVTSAGEFWDVYKLDVVSIPTNEPVRRIDYDDAVYKTKREKYNAVIDEIERYHKAGQPVLVGTISVEVSETIGRMLSRKGIKNYSILNAKYHEKEAEIIAKAGQAGAITIATNMAGRGTDIKLGSGVVKCPSTCCILCEHEAEQGCATCPDKKERKLVECLEDVPCGLHIIGTERHEAMRIDRQLRGRSGRQGDPGSSKFYLSLEDDLMRLFGSDKLVAWMDKLGVEEGEVITHPWVTKAIATAQKRVEEHNFSIRKRLLEYDDIMNKQREVVYELRRALLHGTNIEDWIIEILIPDYQPSAPVAEEMTDTPSGITLKQLIIAIADELIQNKLDEYANDKTHPEDWDLKSLFNWYQSFVPTSIPVPIIDPKTITQGQIFDQLSTIFRKVYDEREKLFGEEFRFIEKMVVLQTVDSKWRDHLLAMDMVKEGIGLRAYGATVENEPLIAYKKEAHNLFMQMIDNIKTDILSLIFRVQPILMATPEQTATQPQRTTQPQRIPFGRQPIPGQPKPAKPQPVQSKKIGRNDPCPCGSGKKYKKCCGAAILT
ncbi:MAG: preprotein translocase subunit SecA [bacterium]|nr:preprotein translocase subunit SecA [bacterium]